MQGLNLDNYPEDAEDDVWKRINPNNIWPLDKLILSRKLGYKCGPVGLRVPKPGWYIVRPCVNMMGLGLGAQKVWLEKTTHHLPVGHFWCEFFTGRHISLDYAYGLPKLCVEGFKSDDTFTRWDSWIKVDDFPAMEKCLGFPKILDEFIHWPEINCEFIGSKLIEVHFRPNPDFTEGMTEFIPVWEGQSIDPPEGYSYRPCPDIHGRVGAFIK